MDGARGSILDQKMVSFLGFFHSYPILSPPYKREILRGRKKEQADE
jgi:hypothetical protein